MHHNRMGLGTFHRLVHNYHYQNWLRRKYVYVCLRRCMAWWVGGDRGRGREDGTRAAQVERIGLRQIKRYCVSRNFKPHYGDHESAF